MSETGRRPYLVLFEIGAAALLLLLAFAVAAKGVVDMHRYPTRPVEAAAFVAPSGCVDRPAAVQVARACAAATYRLTGVSDLGLNTTRSDEQWYRVGDDALLLLCVDGGQTCVVRSRVSGKFVRPADQQA